MSEKTINLLTSKYYILFCLAAAFVFYYAFNRGAATTWIELGGIFVVVNIVLKKYPVTHICSYPTFLFIGVFLLFLLISLAFSMGFSHDRAISRIVEWILVILTILCYAHKETDYQKIYYIFMGLLLFTVTWHVLHFYPSPKAYVKDTNKHILANFLLVLIPFFCFFLLTIKRWYKYFLIPFLLVCLDILLKTQDRPALLGLLFSCLVAIVFFIKGKYKAIILLGGSALVTVLVVSNYGNAFGAVKTLFANISSEERVFLWGDAVHMIMDEKKKKKILGHGIGSFRFAYADHASVDKLARQVFPHNFFLQIFYELGLIGFLGITGLFVFIFYLLFVAITSPASQKTKIFAQCLFVYYLSWKFHCGLTVGFFSQYSLYPFAFIVGCVNVLYLMTKERQLED